MSGAFPSCTARARAGPPPELVARTVGEEALLFMAFTARAPAEVPLFVTWSILSPMLPVRLVAAEARLFCPRIKFPPVAPRAVVAAPTTSASTTARPTTAEVALPNHSAFPRIPLNTSRSSL